MREYDDVLASSAYKGHDTSRPGLQIRIKIPTLHSILL